MEYFDKSKKSIIEKLQNKDKSRKGDVDEHAIPVINAFNETKNCYTTSSCAGRITLFREAETKKKYDSGWLYVKHGEVTKEEIKNALTKIPLDTIWFRQETSIFHIACRNIEIAKKILNLCQEIGLKHSGIIGINRRIMIEIIFNEKLDSPISENNKLLMNEDHLDLLIKKANEKMRRNNKLLKKLAKKIKENTEI